MHHVGSLLACPLTVKKDLEAVGIPYVTHEGIADFHAAGRHTYITELLRNGATVPEARELARHTDIKMTMKYTHIGIDDQAKALLGLPSSALQMRCNPGVFAGQSVTTPGNESKRKKSLTPRGNKGLGNGCHPLSVGNNMEAAGIE